MSRVAPLALPRKGHLEGDHDAAAGKQLQLIAATLDVGRRGGCADAGRQANYIVKVEQIVEAQLDLRPVEERVCGQLVIEEQVIHPERVQPSRLVDGAVVHVAGPDVFVEESGCPVLVLVGCAR